MERVGLDFEERVVLVLLLSANAISVASVRSSRLVK